MDTPIVAPAFDCGLCDIIHACHCDRVRYGCAVCVPPMRVSESNILAREVAQLAPQSAFAAAQGEPRTVVLMRMPRSA